MRPGIWPAASFGLALASLAYQLAAQVAAPVDPASISNSHRLEWTQAQRDEWASRLREAYRLPPAQWPKPHIDDGVAFVELGLVPDPPFPATNPYSKEKDELGRKLFFDPNLSGSGHIACASCHDPDLGWADGRTVAFGHGRAAGTRNSPSIMGASHQRHFFWDGRADSLEAQALAVLHNPDEFHSEVEVVVARLRTSQGYRDLFKSAFGDDHITIDRALAALATFVRTINPGKSKFDAFLRGNPDALTDAQIRGLHLFRTEARCANCHHGPLFTDHDFHNLGLTLYGRPHEDLGRYKITKAPEDVGKFKTPSLRNVTRTGPYMHHGLFELDVALRLYKTGMVTERPRKDQENDPLFPTKSPLLQALDLSDADFDDLEAFLLALEEPRTRVRPPVLPAIGDAPSENAATSPR